MEYYSNVERNIVLSHITTLMKVENTILTEKSQAQKATYCVIFFFFLYEMFRMEKSMEKES